MSWERAAMQLAAMSAIMGRHIEPPRRPPGSALDFLLDAPSARDMKITIDLLDMLEPRRPDDPVVIADAAWEAEKTARREREERNSAHLKAAAEAKRQRRRERNLRHAQTSVVSNQDSQSGGER